MKNFTKIFGVSLLVLFAVIALSTVTFAGSGSPEIPGGTAPYGVAMHGDAKGEKLYGSISIEYIGYAQCGDTGSCASSSKILLQLETAKGTPIKTYYQEIPGLSYDPALQANQLLLAFRSQILTDFFGGDKGQSIVLVSFGEFQITPNPQTDPNYIMASITLAVN